MDKFFTQVVDVYRLTKNQEDDTESYELHLKNIPCQIQALSDSYSTDLDGSYGKDFLMFCGRNDIREKDKIIEGYKEYQVVGVEEYQFQGLEHMELRIKLVPLES